MNNTGDFPNDEKQSANITADYRTLLSVTRPLVITEHTLLSWRGGETWRSGFGVSHGPGDSRPESALSRGQVFPSDGTSPDITNDEELAAALEEAGTGSVLGIRICIGMS